jgi:diguanylate cyclase (GGDEF)-like protein
MACGWFRPVHGFSAQLIDVDVDSLTILREVLPDAGCLDIDTDSSIGTLLLARAEDVKPALVIVGIRDRDVRSLQRLAASPYPIPLIAICDEEDIDAVIAAGAHECLTRPLRKREALGRIRGAVQTKPATTQREARERKMCDTIAALEREKVHLERLVCVDPLTGIANRRHAMDMLTIEWKRSAREQTPLALIMIDLDCFHSYNERYGHLGGDACLQQAADAMVRCLRRPSDFLGRYGGEEFMAVLPNTDAAGARIVADRLRASIEALAIPHGGSTCSKVVTTTVGFASFTVLPVDSLERLIGAADEALLKAKAEGRNRVGGIGPMSRPSRESTQRWKQYPPVYVDPCFRSRVPSFLDTVKDEVSSTLARARSGERRSGLVMQRLAQTADQLGLVAVRMLMRDVEAAAREGELSLLRPAAEELVQYVTHVQVVYRRRGENSQVEVRPSLQDPPR